MKQIIFAALVGSFFFLTSCDSTKKTAAIQSAMATAPGITNNKWKLIELHGKSVNKMEKDPILTLMQSDNRYGAYMGCNSLGGTYTLLGKGKIKFDAGMSTMMACPDMSIEDGFKQIISEVDNYSIINNVLSLNKGRMTTLARFELAKDEANTNSLNGSWQLEYITGPRIAFEGLYPEAKPVLTFNLPDTMVAGNGSCNNFSGPVTIKDNNITFGNMMSTKKFCGGDGETTFFKTLQGVNRYNVNGNKLTFFRGDLVAMRFIKK